MSTVALTPVLAARELTRTYEIRRGLFRKPAILTAVAAASFLYVAVADLIPGLHRRVDFRAGVEQILFIATGVGVVWLTHLRMH